MDSIIVIYWSIKNSEGVSVYPFKLLLFCKYKLQDQIMLTLMFSFSFYVNIDNKAKSHNLSCFISISSSSSFFFFWARNITSFYTKRWTSVWGPLTSKHLSQPTTTTTPKKKKKTHRHVQEFFQILKPKESSCTKYNFFRYARSNAIDNVRW